MGLNWMILAHFFEYSVNFTLDCVGRSAFDQTDHCLFVRAETGRKPQSRTSVALGEIGRALSEGIAAECFRENGEVC